MEKGFYRYDGFSGYMLKKIVLTVPSRSMQNYHNVFAVFLTTSGSPARRKKGLRKDKRFYCVFNLEVDHK